MIIRIVIGLIADVTALLIIGLVFSLTTRLAVGWGVLGLLLGLPWRVFVGGGA